MNFVELRDAGDPVEQARLYDAAGADELCFLDITASHEQRDTIYDVVAKTASQVFLPLTVGGGVRSVDDARKLLLAGADKISVNSAAVTRPDLIAELATKFGSQCVVVAIDAKQVGGKFEVFTHGGPYGDRHRRGRLGQTRHPARRWRNPADLDGSRRNAVGIRPGADACGVGRGDRCR